jgi:cytochrome c biogenesis protein CcdA
MALLIIFAFVAGAATAISPCVLPVLPIALSAGATGGKRRPLGVVSGLAVSFTFATVALVYVIDALGLPNELLRKLAIGVLFVFGVILLVPPMAARVEAFASRLSSRFGVVNKGDGFWSGILLGLSLGLLYAPCAGPILAGVIVSSASESFTLGKLAVALSYGIGSAVVLYALLLGGRRLAAPLARRGIAFQMAMGAVMVLVAVAMFRHYDTRLEETIASSWPSFLATPAESLEHTHSAQVALSEIRGGSGHGLGV